VIPDDSHLKGLLEMLLLNYHLFQKHVKYLIEIETNEQDKVQTQYLRSNSMLNYHLSQKFKLIRRDKFNHFNVFQKKK
jgi:hypothetical protein